MIGDLKIIEARSFVIPTGVRPSSRRSSGVEEPAVVWWVKFSCLMLLLAGLSSKLTAQELPKGWRRPHPAETTEGWRRKSSTRFFVVKADFDGDGKEDIAELLISPSTNKFSLFVRLAATDRWEMVGEPTDLGYLGSFGVDVVKPGRYETACGKGYDDSFCAHGEPDYLRLTRPAIDLIYHESADVIFYWDPTIKKFKQIQMSD